jgi:hypothetical protein
MEAARKVLIVDKSIDRKTRIGAVRERGFAVFPALKLSEARGRCRPGAYDLIVVHGADELDACLALCDQLRERVPPQPVLLVMPDASKAPDRDYVVQGDAKAIADRVEAMFGRMSRGAAVSEGSSRGDMPARATA